MNEHTFIETTTYVFQIVVEILLFFIIVSHLLFRFLNKVDYNLKLNEFVKYRVTPSLLQFIFLIHDVLINIYLRKVLNIFLGTLLGKVYTLYPGPFLLISFLVLLALSFLCIDVLYEDKVLGTVTYDDHGFVILYETLWENISYVILFYPLIGGFCLIYRAVILFDGEEWLSDYVCAFLAATIPPIGILEYIYVFLHLMSFNVDYFIFVILGFLVLHLAEILIVSFLEITDTIAELSKKQKEKEELERKIASHRRYLEEQASKNGDTEK